MVCRVLDIESGRSLPRRRVVPADAESPKPPDLYLFPYFQFPTPYSRILYE